MNGQTYLRDYIKNALTSDFLAQPDVVAPDDQPIVSALYESHRRNGRQGATRVWKQILQTRPELVNLFPYIEPINVKLSQGDVWALKRATTNMPIDPSVKVSPLVRLLIKGLSRTELQSLILNDSLLFGDVLDIDPNNPPDGFGVNELFIPFGELEDMPLPPYAVDRYPIYERGMNLLYGLPGVGKSFIAIDFIGHVAARYPEKTIIYAAPEGWSSVPVRWKAWCQLNGVTPKNVVLMKQPLRVTKSDQLAQVEQEIAGQGFDVHFIVFDTLARAMVGDNENDTREMNVFIDALDKLRDQLDCGILLIHHVNKLGQLRGSTVLDGALDSIIKAQKDSDQLVLHNRQDKGGKNRHRPEADPVYLRLRTVEVEIRGEVDKAGVVELVEKSDPLPVDESLSTRQREMLEALDGYDGGMTVNQLFDATLIPKPTIYRYIKQLGGAGYLYHDKAKDQIAITDSGRTAYRQ